jgi:peptide/nickel transport system substrate-binding protein
LIAEQFKAVGVAAEVRPMDVAAINELVYVKRGFDMNIQTLTTGPDPAMGMERQYVSTNIRPIPYTNAIGYRNPKVDTLFQQAANSADRSERARLYKEISAILVDDAAMVWLYQNTPYSAFRSEFGNLHNRFAESIYNYGDVYWKGGSATRS